MKFVLFNDGRPGLLRDEGVIDISLAVDPGGAVRGQEAMEAVIVRIEELRPELSRMEHEGDVIGLADVTLEAPLPLPNKILCMGGNYREFGARNPEPMWGFRKAQSAIIGPGGAVELPDVDANIFHHEAELVAVFGRGGKDIKQADAMDSVFGYLCGVDVSARIYTGGPRPPRPTTELPIAPHKSYDTFAPIGPCIATKDEIVDPHHLQVQLRVNDELRVNYNTDDLAHSIAESIEFATAMESVAPGDMFFIGTNHQGLGAMQDGDNIEIEIESIGRFSFQVTDRLKRVWARGVDEATATDIRESAGGPGAKVRPL
ncbi:MAG TPA: fumarylacetoacetate hydrolase [Dehalococcoidia bacterium]|nr:fumarylacetoacetate hydrolase [Dehalococcoidia bacterium]